MLLKMLKEEKGIYLFTLACLLPTISTLCTNLAFAYMLKMTEYPNNLLWIGFLCAGAAFICLPAVLKKLQTSVQIPFQKHYIATVKKKVFENIMNLDFEMYIRKGMNTYLSVLINDMQMFENQYLSSFITLIESITTIFVGLVLMIIIDYRLAGIVFAVIALLFGIGTFIRHILSTQKLKVSKENSMFIGCLENTLSGQETIYLSNAMETFVQKLCTKSLCQEKTRKKYFLLEGVSDVVLSKMSSILLLAALAFLAFMMSKNRMTISQAAIAVLAINMVTQNIRKLLPAYVDIRSTEDLLKDWLEKSYEEDDSVVTESAQSVAENDILMNLDNLCFSYQNKKVIENLSEKIYQGDKILVRGASGCGKSTLLSIMSGLRDGYGGSIRYKGREINTIPKKEYFQNIAMIFQDVFLYSDTLKNNITLFQEMSQEALDDAIDRSGLRPVVNELEFGYDTVLTQNGIQLSGGQRQRISIARAIITKSNIIFADEPTASLSEELAEEIEDELLNIKETVIVVSHRENLKEHNNITKIINLS